MTFKVPSKSFCDDSVFLPSLYKIHDFPFQSTTSQTGFIYNENLYLNNEERDT